MSGLFGTDGVRGTANTHPMTAETALRIGQAAGAFFRKDGQDAHRVVIGKDTRLSGYMLENALTAGLTSMGMNVLLLGPVPTPAVGHLTRSMRADLGIMISASHNPAEDNGIKFFGPDGFKLSDEDEDAISRFVGEPEALVPAEAIGRAKRIEEAGGRYAEACKASSGVVLNGLKVVIDAANGAAHRVAPNILWELGADVVPIGVEPNGRNINRLCGSTHPEAAAEAVMAHGADVGICLDGDADRVMIVDEAGVIADGDQIMALIADNWAASGRLRGGALVATVMSNLGLERFLAERDINLVRTKVGDRHVVEAMRAGGYNLGGEQSGHIVLLDHATTGDGLMAGLQFLSAMQRTGRPASELTRQFQKVPQKLVNVVIPRGTRPHEEDAVLAAIRAAEGRLNGSGRVLIRPSGTEPKVRVMGEHEDAALLDEVVSEIASAVERAS